MAHKLRVTIEPGVVREVDDAELVDLARQGLIHSYEHTDAAEAVLDSHGAKAPKKAWKEAPEEEPVVTGTPDAAATSTDTKGK